MRMPFWIFLIAIWAAFNCSGWVVINWYERTVAEDEHGLRRGILSEFEPRSLEVILPGGNKFSLRYRVFSPELGNSQAKLPVVLSLHGSGERGIDNTRQLRLIPARLSSAEFQAKFPCFIISPQCWPSTDWTSLRRQLAAGPVSEDDVLCRIIASVLESPYADPKRIYLVGYSMGSFGAWQLAAEHQNMFAAIVPISGGGPVELADRLSKTPIYTVHGATDRICPVQQTRDIVDAIKARGGDIQYQEIENAGHSLTGERFDDLKPVFEWMYGQVREN